MMALCADSVANRNAFQRDDLFLTARSASMEPTRSEREP
jgi:hypothetical protein